MYCFSVDSTRELESIYRFFSLRLKECISICERSVDVTVRLEFQQTVLVKRAREREKPVQGFVSSASLCYFLYCKPVVGIMLREKKLQRLCWKNTVTNTLLQERLCKSPVSGRYKNPVTRKLTKTYHINAVTTGELCLYSFYLDSPDLLLSVLFFSLFFRIFVATRHRSTNGKKYCRCHSDERLVICYSLTDIV